MPTRKISSVTVLNQHTGNFGDDAAGDALLGLLLASQDIESIEIVFNGAHVASRINDPRIATDPDRSLARIGLWRLALYWVTPLKLSHLVIRHQGLLSLRRALGQTDLLLVAPCGANIGIYKDWQFLFRLLIALREGAHPVFFWNTIGSSDSRLFNYLAKVVLRRSELNVRESASADYLNSLGLNCRTGFDTAFALPPRERARASTEEQTISIVAAELASWHPHYLGTNINANLRDALVQYSQSILETPGTRLQLLPHLRSPEETEFKEAIVEGLRRAGLAECRATFRSDIRSVAEYDEAIAASSLVIAGRYHAAVLAAKNGTPFIALAYENKMIEVCSYLNIPTVASRLAPTSSTGAIVGQLQELVRKAEGVDFGQLTTLIADSIAPRIGQPLRDRGLL